MNRRLGWTLCIVLLLGCGDDEGPVGAGGGAGDSGSGGSAGQADAGTTGGSAGASTGGGAGSAGQGGSAGSAGQGCSAGSAGSAGQGGSAGGGYAPGHFESTPFPIDESTTEYTVVNDDGSQSFALGSKRFVDGGTGQDQGDCQSFASPCQTIGYAVEQAPSGNVTIIVRGAHDAFDGVYTESGLRPKAGTDHAHRFTLVGYAQERPVIDGGGLASDIVGGTGEAEAFVTLQRLKLQNSQSRCVRLGNLNEKRDGHFALIDLWAYDCTNQPGSDGNIYYLNVDDGWLHHVTTEHTYGHCLKMGDGADRPLVEWAWAKECGYWAGFPITSYFNNHAAGFDFPNDEGADTTGLVLRHSLVHDVLFYGIQLRRTPDFRVYDNEIHDAARCWNHMSDPSGDCDGHSLGPHQVLVYAGATSGSFHGNVVRDPGAAVASHLRITSCDTGSPEILIFNNLLYGMGGEAISVAGNNTGATVRIMNNSVYGNGDQALISSYMTDRVELINNVLMQDGTGSCADATDAIHHHNLLYAPAGTMGLPLDATDLNADPQWQAIPSNAHDPDECALGTSSPARDAGADLGSLFQSSFNGPSRPQGASWDIGAYESPQ